MNESWAREGFARRAATDVLARNPDFVGISSMCSNYVLALDLAEEIKASSPAVHITFGGPHVSLCARETLDRHSYVDTAVIGEGEVTYPALVECVESDGDLSHVSGLAFRNHTGTVVTAPRPLLPDLNLSPRPAYDLDLMPPPGKEWISDRIESQLAGARECEHTDLEQPVRITFSNPSVRAPIATFAS